MSGLTPSPTVGPDFHIGLDWPDAYRLVDDATRGRPIVLQGRLLDGDGAPLPDAMIENWQADASGRFGDDLASGFRGAGRAAVDVDGRFAFESVKPGAVSDAHGEQAAHVNVAVFARGLLVHRYTRICFADESAANATDPVQARLPEARRATLLAHREREARVLAIHSHGAHETVFLDV